MVLSGNKWEVDPLEIRPRQLHSLGLPVSLGLLARLDSFPRSVISPSCLIASSSDDMKLAMICYTKKPCFDEQAK